MVLTNAEKQRRWRERRNKLAKQAEALQRRVSHLEFSLGGCGDRSAGAERSTRADKTSAACVLCVKK